MSVAFLRFFKGEVCKAPPDMPDFHHAAFRCYPEIFLS